MSDYYQFRDETGTPIDYYQLVDDNNELCKEIKRLNKQIEEYQKALDETTSEKVDLHSIIKEALRKLRASKDHFKTQQENNAVTFTIRILEKGDKK